MKNSSVAAHNEWKLVKPLGKPPTKRRRQVCLVVGDKVFLFGGTSPSTVPDSPGIPVHVIDDDHQGLDAKLMDHSDLHVLDCGMFLNFLTWFYLHCRVHVTEIPSLLTSTFWITSILPFSMFPCQRGSHGDLEMETTLHYCQKHWPTIMSVRHFASCRLCKWIIWLTFTLDTLICAVTNEHHYFHCVHFYLM